MNELTSVGLEWLGALALFLAFIVFIRYLDHRERMSMIERGLTPPVHGMFRRATRGSAVLRGGLITGAVGIAITLGLYTLGYLLPPPFNAVPGRLGPWLLPGLIPTGVGAALVASYYLAPPRGEQHDESLGDTHTTTRGDRSAAENESARRSRIHVVGEEGASRSTDGHDAADA